MYPHHINPKLYRYKLVRFVIKFVTSHEKLGLFDNFQEADGLNLVELVKEETGLDVSPGTISKSCNLSLRSSEQSFYVGGKYEEEIMKHPTFKHFPEVKVVIPAGWFGQYVYEKVVVDRIRKHENQRYGPDHICKLRWWFRHTVKGLEFPYYGTTVTNEWYKNQVLEDWFESGMPDYWGLDEERHTEMVMREIACEEERERVKAVRARKAEEELKRKRQVDLQYFSDELELMAKKLKGIQKVYNGS